MVAQEVVVITFIGAFDHSCIERVDAEFRGNVGVQLDAPYAFDFLHEHVRNDVLVVIVNDLTTGAWVEAADQDNRLAQCFFTDLELAADLSEVVARQQSQVFADDGPGIGDRFAGRQLAQLYRHAFAYVAGATAGRIELMNHAENRFYFIEFEIDLFVVETRVHALGEFFERL